MIDGYHDWYDHYPETVVVDKAYDSQELVRGLMDRGIQPYIRASEYGQEDLIRLGEHWNLKTRHLSLHKADMQMH